MGTVATAKCITAEVSMDKLLELGWDLEGTGQLEGLEIAYHEGEITKALDVLTPAQRKYVVARFWGRKTPAELEALFGYDPASLWRVAKPKLQLRLAKLKGLVTV